MAKKEKKVILIGEIREEIRIIEDCIRQHKKALVISYTEFQQERKEYFKHIREDRDEIKELKSDIKKIKCLKRKR